MSTQTAIGIDVGGTGTKGGVVDASGRVLHKVIQETDVTSGTKGVIAVAERLLGWAGDSGLDITSVGIGAAGFVDSISGSITFSPNFTYDDPEIATAVGARFGLPVVVDNDANAAAWGERTFGSARGSDQVVLLSVGTGIGSGFIVDGRLVRGFTGAGAELGHTVVHLGGPECHCGLRGCLEQLASGQAIERMAREAARDDPSTLIVTFAESVEAIEGEHVAQAAAKYDEVALRILRTAGKALGVGLSNAVNLFDPEVLVLAGSVIRAGEPYLGPARDQLVRMTGAQRRRPARLDVTALGEDVGIVGAAALGAGWGAQ
jgi:glucokinase